MLAYAIKYRILKARQMVNIYNVANPYRVFFHTNKLIFEVLDLIIF